MERKKKVFISTEYAYVSVYIVKIILIYGRYNFAHILRN